MRCRGYVHSSQGHSNKTYHKQFTQVKDGIPLGPYLYGKNFCERFPCTSVFKTIYLRLNNRPYSRSKVLNHWILLHLCDMIPILHTLVHFWTLNTAVSCSLHEQRELVTLRFCLVNSLKFQLHLAHRICSYVGERGLKQGERGFLNVGNYRRKLLENIIPNFYLSMLEFTIAINKTFNFCLQTDSEFQNIPSKQIIAVL